MFCFEARKQMHLAIIGLGLFIFMMLMSRSEKLTKQSIAVTDGKILQAEETTFNTPNNNTNRLWRSNESIVVPPENHEVATSRNVLNVPTIDSLEEPNGDGKNSDDLDAYIRGQYHSQTTTTTKEAAAATTDDYEAVCSPRLTFAEAHAKYRSPYDLDSPDNRLPSATEKIILLWNPLFKEDSYGVKLGSRTFTSCECPVRCSLTRDTAQLPSADAVLIHTFFLTNDNVSLPTRAFPDQVFVFFLLESPVMALHSMHELPYNDVFNVTMTYLDHPDTDIFAPVGDFTARHRHDGREVPSEEYIAGKSGLVAWMASNCDPASARNIYIKELSRYINVDIYGQCGNLSCPMGDDYGQQCWRNLSAKYLFYLSFENSYCEGYITEKVFNPIFMADILPVVYGGANFTAMLPPYSYINIHHYKSPRHLANHLLYLDKHRDEYRNYFLWRKDWRAVGDYHHRARGFCKLCKILNSKKYPYKSKFDLLSYWNADRHCLNATEELKAVHLYS